jgi:hypothetical protein
MERKLVWVKDTGLKGLVVGCGKEQSARAPYKGGRATGRVSIYDVK